jgi:hypothetical protein
MNSDSVIQKLSSQWYTNLGRIFDRTDTKLGRIFDRTDTKLGRNASVGLITLFILLRIEGLNPLLIRWIWTLKQLDWIEHYVVIWN